MAELKQELISNIFVCLPVKSLVRFRCLSKPIQIEIDDVSFINAHLALSIQTNSRHKLLLGRVDNLQSVDFDEGLVGRAIKLSVPPIGSEIIGSCNGLLLLYSSISYSFIYTTSRVVFSLWNPFTRRHKKLPDLPDFSAFTDTLMGFGYDSETNDHKVVLIDDAKVLVFSLNSNAWRRLPVNNCHEKLSEAYDMPFGTFSNGFLHWRIFSIRDTTCIIRILSFDLSKEEFLQVIPPIQAYHEMPYCLLQVLRPGNMFLLEQETLSNEDEGDGYGGTSVVLHEMVKINNGDDDISFEWRKLHRFVLNKKDYGCWATKILQLSKDGKKILMLAPDSSLGWYDIKLNTFLRLHISGGVEIQYIARGIFCWESLVPLGATT